MNDMFQNPPDLADAISLAAARQDATEESITLCVEKYEHMLDDPNLTEAQRRAFIEAVWLLIINIVDFGYGVHPVQEVCGQLLSWLDDDDIVCLDALELSSDIKLKDQESADADPGDPPASGRIP